MAFVYEDPSDSSNASHNSSNPADVVISVDEKHTVNTDSLDLKTAELSRANKDRGTQGYAGPQLLGVVTLEDVIEEMIGEVSFSLSFSFYLSLLSSRV